MAQDPEVDAALFVAAGTSFSAGSIPVLILNGELDHSLTPAARREAHRAPARAVRTIDRGPEHGAPRRVVRPVRMRRAALVRRFLQRPHQLATLDARCGRHIPEVHALGKVHATVGQTDRSLASMALNAAGDAATRWTTSPVGATVACAAAW